MKMVGSELVILGKYIYILIIEIKRKSYNKNNYINSLLILIFFSSLYINNYFYLNKLIVFGMITTVLPLLIVSRSNYNNFIFYMYNI